MLRLLRGRGFSLPEVAIALAVAGVAVISVVGLMPGLLTSEQSSGANTAVTAMATQALGYARNQPYYQSGSNVPPTAYTLFFGQDGNLLTRDGTPNGAPITDAQDVRAIYACKVTQTTINQAPNFPTDPTTSQPTESSPGTHCRMVTLDFSWPANLSTSANNRNHKTIYATLSGG